MKHAIVVLAVLGALLAVPGEAGAVTFGLQFGSAGSGNGQFKGDYGVAVDPSGNVWVADSGTSNTGNNRIQVFSGTGAYITQYGSYGNTSTAAGYFNRPKGVAVNLNSGASLGDVWVSDTGNNRIQMYDVSTGLWAKYVSSFALSSPQGLDVDTSGNVWVADFNNNRIQKYNVSLNSWTTIYGNNPLPLPSNSFLNPSDVAVDPSGVVWVADTGHSTIQKGVLSGSIWSWTQYGSGYLSSPRGLDLDPLGNVWVTDSGNNQIAMYDVTANTWTSYGASGTGPGQFNFPTGIAVDALGNMWVADTGNNRIQSTVPEPVTMAGLALGLSCLTNYIRRRRTA